MWKLTKNILKYGIQTEKFESQEAGIEVLGQTLSVKIKKIFNRSLNIRVVDSGSCNLCELEIQATNNPFYALERFGIHFVASPRHADMLLITGPVTKNMQEAVLKTYEATPTPKLVLAIGDCAYCGGVFNESYAVIGAVNRLIPVDVIVKGCPPTPLDIINGILQALKIPHEK